ncbi:MAG: hypothetical protein BYD32DRAFT_432030 [Podila humilis]|nr:MAG: hypothetical protein BYD32DRAFT_432030 [Podila humilis]
MALSPNIGSGLTSSTHSTKEVKSSTMSTSAILHIWNAKMDENKDMFNLVEKMEKIVEDREKGDMPPHPMQGDQTPVTKKKTKKRRKKTNYSHAPEAENENQNDFELGLVPDVSDDEESLAHKNLCVYGSLTVLPCEDKQHLLAEKLLTMMSSLSHDHPVDKVASLLSQVNLTCSEIMFNGGNNSQSEISNNSMIIEQEEETKIIYMSFDSAAVTANLGPAVALLQSGTRTEVVNIGFAANYGQSRPEYDPNSLMHNGFTISLLENAETKEVEQYSIPVKPKTGIIQLADKS